MDKHVEQQIDQLQETVASLYAGMHEMDEANKKKQQAIVEGVLAEYRKKFTPEQMSQVEQHWKSLEPHSKLVGSRDANSTKAVPTVSMRLHERYRILKIFLKKKPS